MDEERFLFGSCAGAGFGGDMAKGEPGLRGDAIATVRKTQHQSEQGYVYSLSDARLSRRRGRQTELCRRGRAAAHGCRRVEDALARD